jgi:3-oxoacyl-[acyl-carrier protein] reductase
MEIIGFGVGNVFKKYKAVVEKSGEITRFCDNNPLFWEKEVAAGVRCYPPRILTENNDILLVLFIDDNDYLIEISSQLALLGVKNICHYTRWLRSLQNDDTYSIENNHDNTTHNKERKLIPIYTPIDRNRLLNGRIALVTGGSSGIGCAIAREFVRNGAKVVIAGRNEDNLVKISNELNCKYILLDVMDVNSIAGKVRDVLEMYPEHRIDILVNSAGIVNKVNSFMETTEEDFDAVMQTNVKGTYFVSQVVSKCMISDKNSEDGNVTKHILNISSSSSLRPAWTPYQISKWGITGFTKGLADTLLPHGIIVNAIAPGPTATRIFGKEENDDYSFEHTPSKRFTAPAEVANWAVYLVSELGNQIVGDTLYITGGSGVISLNN